MIGPSGLRGKPFRGKLRYLGVPVYDSPCLLAERDAFAWDGLPTERASLDTAPRAM